MSDAYMADNFAITMSSHSTLASRGAVQAAASAVANAVGNRPYAIVGGAACLLLGSVRQTEDVDLVVPKNTVVEYRKLFRTPDATRLGFKTGTQQPRHTFHGQENVLIELLSPPGMFKTHFDANTPTVLVNGIRVLHPLFLLDAKCGALISRSEQKRFTDAQDIIFLLGYCVAHGLKITTRDVPNASPDNVEYLISQGWVSREVWAHAGYVQGSEWSAIDSPPYSAAHPSFACRGMEVLKLGDHWLPEVTLRSPQVRYHSDSGPRFDVSLFI